MKKGKLFGKLNIIDILVLLVLIVAVGLFAYRMFRPAEKETIGSEISVSEPNLKFSVLCDNVPRELAENIDKSVHGEERDLGGEIVSPRRIYNSGKLMDAEIVECTIIETGDESLVQLRFDLQAHAELNSGAYAIGWQEIRLANVYSVKTVEIEIEGPVVSMENIS